MPQKRKKKSSITEAQTEGRSGRRMSFNVHLNDEERDILRRAAKSKGFVGVGAYIRTKALEIAKKDLGE